MQCLFKRSTDTLPSCCPSSGAAAAVKPWNYELCYTYCMDVVLKPRDIFTRYHFHMVDMSKSISRSRSRSSKSDKSSLHSLFFFCFRSSASLPSQVKSSSRTSICKYYYSCPYFIIIVHLSCAKLQI